MRQRDSVTYLLCSVIYILFALPCYPAYGAKPIACGMDLPQFTLEAPTSKEARQYLGLKDLKHFSIYQVSAKLVLIELYSLYCPVCQRQAPIANKIHKFIQRDSVLSKDIRLIGIGVGNNQRETTFYKSKYRVPFPLFCDPKFDIHRKFGESRTPTTILVTSAGKVLLTHFGIVKDMDKFLRQIRKFHKQQ